MKKLYLLIIALAVTFTVKAQWVNDPVNNTFIANTSYDAGEIYLSTNPETGDTYVQYSQFWPNNWSPTIQRVDVNGVPQWGDEGIHLGYHQFSSYSEGVAMVATTDGGVVSCFAAGDYSYAVKLNADGTFAWGEEGVQLFNGNGFSRTECIAGNDGGVWCLGFDYSNLYAQYVNADGTTNPTATISAFGQSCKFGQLTLGNDNNVFVTYEITGSGLYTDKQIAVVGYAVDGTQVTPPTTLMSDSGSFQSTYLHHAISDGMGGGYVYIWHPGLNDAFNTYVFHFNQNGASTIMDPHGVPVHTPDPDYYYGNAYATVDPVTHNIIIAYEETDSYSQSLSAVYVNSITPDGYVLWDDGVLVINNGTAPCQDIRVDEYQYGGGFMVSYLKYTGLGSQSSVIEAKGYDDKCILQWETTMNSVSNWKVAADNSTGYHNGQNILMWISHDNGGLYGQNIGQFGEMGEVTPPVPPAPCDAPTDFIGFFTYDDWVHVYGAELTWTAPEETPLHYMLYRENIDNGETASIEVEANDYTLYFDVLTVSGDYIYRLTAVYEDCESDYALTPNGDNYILIEAIVPTSVSEIEYEEIVDIVEIYNVNGQIVNIDSINDLSQGVYIVKGLTASGKAVIRKICR